MSSPRPLRNVAHSYDSFSVALVGLASLGESVRQLGTEDLKPAVDLASEPSRFELLLLGVVAIEDAVKQLQAVVSDEVPLSAGSRDELSIRELLR